MGFLKFMAKHLHEMKNMYSIHKTTSQQIGSPINEQTVRPAASSSHNKASNPNQTPIICYPGSINEPSNNNLFSLNPNMGYRTVNHADKDALLEAFKQKIGYDVDQDSLMDTYKQNLVTRGKNPKQIKSN